MTYERSKRLVVDFDDLDGLIGWTGHDVDRLGSSVMTSCGVGHGSWALSEIALWLFDARMVEVQGSDGSTHTSVRL
jgi:hypothetical protein